MATREYLNETGLGQVWAKIKALITQSDWKEDDSSKNSYVQNRPAIRAGEGENSIIEGQIEQDSNAAVYTIYVSGDANATTYSYTTEDTLPSSSLLRNYGVIEYDNNTVIKYTTVNSYNTTTNTIILNSTLSTTALENAEIKIYFRYKMAEGEYSHAEGDTNMAFGNSSHAEGSGTKATEIYSHSEGYNTSSINVASHAEGVSTTASGYYSHAEGRFTKAIGTSSHTEGNYTTASGNQSHAEGNYTEASNTYSHVEGSYATASGPTSHAEGYYTIANGDTSHAEGGLGVASGYRTHVEGGWAEFPITIRGDANALTYTVSSTTTFTDTDILAKERMVIYYNRKFYRITDFTISDNQITSVTLENTLSTSAVNGNATLDIGNLAKLTASHAEGAFTTANGSASHAEGIGTITSGMGAHAEGYNTKAAHNYAHSEGRSTIAQEATSHAEGMGSIAKAIASHSQNYYTIAAKSAQTALGTYNIEDTSETTTHPSEDTDFGQYAVIVGNGSDGENRSNAHTLDWSGNAWYAGKLTVGTGPVNNMDVATKQYVDTAAASVSVSCATMDEIEEMCDALGFQSVTIDTSDYVDADE